MDQLFLAERLSGFNINYKMECIVCAVFYVSAEIWCIISMIRVFRDSSNLKNIPLVLFFLTLHLILIFRVLTDAIYAYDLLPNELYLKLYGVVLWAKDCMTAFLITRILEAVRMQNEDQKARNIIIGIYIGLGIHIALFFPFTFLTAFQGPPKSLYSPVIQAILLVLFIYSYYLFHQVWSRMDEESKKSRIMFWLMVLIIYAMIFFAIRVIHNVLVFANIIELMRENYPLAVAIYLRLNFGLSEVVPCALISTFLYILAVETQEEEQQPLNPEPITQGQAPETTRP